MARKTFEKRQRTLVNVAPFTAFDIMRETGYHFLPARPEGKRFASVVVGDVISKQPLGDDKYQEVATSADDLADGLINDNAADKFGCFVADGAEPTDAELTAAEAVYDTWRRKQVVEADTLWEQYHKHSFIGDHAKRACKELGLKRTWLEDVAKTKQCPNCGLPNLPEQARCACGAILDYDRALEFGLLTEREERRAYEAGKFKDRATPPEARTTALVEADDEAAL